MDKNQLVRAKSSKSTRRCGGCIKDNNYQNNIDKN